MPLCSRLARLSAIPVRVPIVACAARGDALVGLSVHRPKYAKSLSICVEQRAQELKDRGMEREELVTAVQCFQFIFTIHFKSELQHVHPSPPVLIWCNPCLLSTALLSVLKLVLTFLGKLQLAALKDLEATRKAGHMPIEDLKECEAYRDFAAQFGEVKAEKDLCV